MRALANPGRIKILKMLADRSMGFKEIKEALGVESPTVPHNLKLLVRTGMVKKGR